jgi:hypothetical protein
MERELSVFATFGLPSPAPVGTGRKVNGNKLISRRASAEACAGSQGHSNMKNQYFGDINVYRKYG